MSLADRLQAALEYETQNSSSKNQAEGQKEGGVRHDFFRGLTAEEIEDFFLNCAHQKRIDYVDQGSRKIPKQHWWKFSAYVNYNDSANSRWGLDSTHTKDLEDATICEYDDGKVQELIVEYVLSESSSKTSEGRQGYSFGFSRFLNIGTSTETTEGETESASEGKTVVKTITQCQTDRGDCKLNRQAFIRYGREVVSRGSGYRTYLDQELDRIAADAGIEVEKPGSRTSTDTG